jgi:hypothetical protein
VRDAQVALKVAWSGEADLVVFADDMGSFVYMRLLQPLALLLLHQQVIR